jgi:glycosyltransferase involved in cell wall biosynthesis
MLAVHRHRDTWTRDLDYHIALTEFARSRFIRAGVLSEKVMVKPNFVYPDPGVDLDCDRQYTLFVGRLSDARFRTILEAWHLLPRIPLVVIGGGPDLERMKSEAARRGLANIRFAGHLPRQDTLQAMRHAKMLVFTSEWYENFPVTIAESFASGVPVICSKLGAMEEIVDNGRTGLHFRVGDRNDLAAKVEWLWSHEDQRRSMGREARHEFETKYTADHNYPLLMEIYERALENSRGSAPRC